MNWAPGSKEVTGVSTDSASQRPSSAKYTIQLPVPVDQTETAVRLIQSMYQKVPTVADLCPQQLLQLLLLADRFEVPKVQLAVLDAFSALSVDDLDWDTALALLDLPFSCAHQDGCKQVCDLATAKLLHMFGDLEEVWANQQLQESLLGLPHAALLRLVQHDELRVAHERTVVFTIMQWWHRQQAKADIASLKQLLQQVRMQHLGHLYTATVMMPNAAVRRCFTVPELGCACICTNPSSLAALQEAKTAELHRFPAWTAPRRPASSRQQVLEWRLPLTELQQAVEQDPCSKLTAKVFSHSAVLQGLKVQLKAQISVQDDSSTQQNHNFGVYFKINNLSGCGVCAASVIFTLVATHQPEIVMSRTRRSVAQSYDVANGPYKHAHSAASSSWGYRNMLNFGSVGSWSDIERVCRDKKLVHADDCLHITAELLEAS